MKKILALDGNWYIWRCAHTYKSSRPMDQLLPYQVLSLMLDDALATRSDYIMFALDGPKVFRYNIYPEYKANRTGRTGTTETSIDTGTLKDQVYGTIPSMLKLFDLLGVPYFNPKTYEADDVLCSIATTYSKQYKIVVGTKDKDAYQYLNKDVCLYDSTAKDKKGKRRPVYITHVDAERIKGVSIRQMIDYQTLIGDKLDNVLPIAGFTPSKAKKVLTEFGSIKEWKRLGSKEDKKFITTAQVHMDLNRELVTLKTKEALPPTSPDQWKLNKEKSKDSKLGRNYHDYHQLQWPKTKGLFK